MEAAAYANGKSIEDYSTEELEGLWQDAKQIVG